MFEVSARKSLTNARTKRKHSLIIIFAQRDTHQSSHSREFSTTKWVNLWRPDSCSVKLLQWQCFLSDAVNSLRELITLRRQFNCNSNVWQSANQKYDAINGRAQMNAKIEKHFETIWHALRDPQPSSSVCRRAMETRRLLRTEIIGVIMSHDILPSNAVRRG